MMATPKDTSASEILRRRRDSKREETEGNTDHVRERAQVQATLRGRHMVRREIASARGY